MALVDHFAQDAGTDPGENGFHKVSAHGFSSSFAFGTRGIYGNESAARTRIAADHNLGAPDVAQFDQLVAAYTALTTNGDRALFIIDLERALIAYESGNATVSELVTFLGL